MSAQTTLSTDREVHDGVLADMALPADASTSPADQRGWIAQGRVRAAIRLSDGKRMDAENQTFDAVNGNAETLVAVELDEANHYLYTLSSGALYRDEIAGTCVSSPCTTSPLTPANPGTRTYFDFSSTSLTPISPALATGELLVDVKLIPHSAVSGCSDDYVLVLTNYRLVVMSSNSFGLSVHSQCLDLHTMITGTGNHYFTSTSQTTFNTFHVNSFVRAKVAIDHTGRTVAYVLANVGAYNIHAPRPLLMLCDLRASSCFSGPTFDVDTSGSTEYVYWSPFQASPAFTGTDATGIHENSARDLDVNVVGSTRTEVYVACGRQKQLRCVTADFVSAGISPRSTITLDSGQDLHIVRFDSGSANELYVRGSASFFDLDLSASPVSWTQLGGEPFYDGRLGDSAQVLMSSTGASAKTIWTMGSGTLDYNVKAYNVTGATPSVQLGLGYFWRSDGGVALDFSNTYVLTAGGVRHYHLNGSAWEFGDYQPSIDLVSSPAYGEGFTEQIELGHIGTGDDRLLGPTNTGSASGLSDWHLDSSAEPQPSTFYPIAATTAFPGWVTGDVMYTDDLVFVTAGSERYAVLCPTRLPGTGTSTREVALVLFRWNAGTSAWVQSASAHDTIGSGLANTITVVDLSPSGKVAFVATDAGIMSFAMRSLSSGSPTVSVATNDATGSTVPSTKTTAGIVATGSRLIVAYTFGSASEYVIYGYNTTTGAITLTGTTTITSASLSLPSSFGRTFRLRFDPTTAPNGYLYDSNDGAQVFRLLYNASGSGSLSYDAHWSTLDSSVLQDCRPYTFGGTKKLLVTKDGESFGWVLP